MTLAQKRQRRIELLIDQRLVGFLKPRMTVSSNPTRRNKKVTELRRPDDKREERAS